MAGVHLAKAAVSGEYEGLGGGCSRGGEKVWMLIIGLMAASEAGGTQDKVTKTEAEWRKVLSKDEFRILREKGTERAFTGKYWDSKAKGVYSCAGCGQALFSSEHKFRSGTGWPSFYQALSDEAVGRERDESLWMTRTEIVCSRCDGHLGHVFRDGPPPTGERFCVNGTALNFTSAGGAK